MPISDNERAIFVKQDYRYATAIDSAVKAKNQMAREIAIDTNLSEADAITRANNELAFNESPRYFELEIEGILTLNDFVEGPLSYLLDFPEYKTENRQATVVSFSADYNTNTTVIGVRG